MRQSSDLSYLHLYSFVNELEGDSVSLYTRESGPSNAPTIVFLHGGPLSSAMWQPQIERLTEFHCLAPDLPEQGMSADIAPFTLADAAHRVAELIRERVPTGKAHVIGLSAGGGVALRLLRDTPMVVDHMLVSGAPARISPLLARLNDLNAPVIHWLGPERITDMIMRQFHTPQQYRPLVLEGIQQGKPSFIIHYDQELTKIELPQETPVPLLICVGQKETLPAKHSARQIARTIHGAKGVMVPGVNHFWSLENVDLFTQTIRAWITDTALPDGFIAL